MASWKELVVTAGTSSTPGPIPNPSGGNYQNWLGVDINIAPDSIVEGDTVGTCTSVPLNIEEGMFDYNIMTYTHSSQSTYAWGGDETMWVENHGESITLAEGEALGWIDLTPGADGTGTSCFSVPLHVSASGKVSMAEELRDGIYDTAMLQLTGWYSESALGVAGAVKTGPGLVGAYIESSGTYPRVEVGSALTSLMTNHESGLTIDELYQYNSVDWAYAGFWRLTDHDHDAYEYISGTAGSTVAKGHLQKNVSTLMSGAYDDTTAVLTVDNGQYTGAPFTDDNAKVWHIYNLSKENSSYGDKVAPAASSTLANYMTSYSSGPKRISETVEWNNGASEVAGYATSATHIADNLTPVLFEQTVFNNWLASSLTDVSISATAPQFYVDGDGGAANGTFAAIDPAHAEAGMIFVFGQYLFVNVTDLKAEVSGGLDSGTSAADHATNNVFKLGNIQGFQHVPHMGNIAATNINMYANYNYTSNDDLSLVANQVNLLNTTTGNVAGNGGINGTNEQSLATDLDAFAIQLDPGLDSAYAVNQIGLKTTDISADATDYNREIYFSWIHDAGAASTPAEGRAAANYSSWASDVVPTGTSTAGLLTHASAWIDEVAFGSTPSNSDIEELLGVTEYDLIDPTTIDLSAWDDYFDNLPESCIITIPGDLCHAPGTKPSDEIAGDDSENARVFIRLSDENDGLFA